jgi:hypothetical protein
VVKERLKCRPSTHSIFNEGFIEVYGLLLEYQRLMLISSASISSAVVMILDEAE